jgi:hypothetical protein
MRVERPVDMADCRASWAIAKRLRAKAGAFSPRWPRIAVAAIAETTLKMATTIMSSIMVKPRGRRLRVMSLP